MYIPLETCRARFGEKIYIRQSGSRSGEQVELSQVTLTISDTEGFVQKDGMIFIYIVPKSEITSGRAWEINPQVMKREKLQIDPFFIERARKPNH